MMYRLLAMLLIVSVPVALGACGSGSNDDASATVTVTVDEDDTPTTKQPAIDAADGDGSGDERCTESTAATELPAPAGLDGELTDAANAWLADHPDVTLTAGDLKDPPKVGTPSEPRYGCAAGSHYAYVAQFEGASAWCENDAPGFFEAPPGKPLEATLVSCAGGIDAMCEGIPRAMRSVWFDASTAEACGWNGPADDAGTADPEPASDSGTCSAETGTPLAIVDIHGDVDCDVALRTWRAFEKEGAGGEQPTGWTCFAAREGDGNRLGSCGKDGSAGDVSQWPRSFTAVRS